MLIVLVWNFSFKVSWIVATTPTTHLHHANINLLKQLLTCNYYTSFTTSFYTSTKLQNTSWGLNSIWLQGPRRPFLNHRCRPTPSSTLPPSPIHHLEFPTFSNRQRPYLCVPIVILFSISHSRPLADFLLQPRAVFSCPTLISQPLSLPKPRRTWWHPGDIRRPWILTRGIFGPPSRPS